MENSKEFREFLKNLLLIRKSHATLPCGSFFELPIQYVISNATDVDIMYIPTDICALPVNISTPHDFQGKRFTIITVDTPGFARLYSPDCKEPYKRQASIVEDQHRHGPAWTETLFNLKDIDTNVFIFGILGISKCKAIQRRILEMQIDRVFAIYCPSWPIEADEWKTRERPSGWPPVEIIDKVVATGCHFVAKPHHSSPEDDTQWRFSFSQAEVILIHSWTDVQKYIYHILRLIKSDVVKACGDADGTIICTYFFKTLMFWECERKPKEFWEDENVEKSVSELLYVMIGWLIDGCCPNYFIPSSNMLSTPTERLDFTKEIQLFFNYATFIIGDITTVWPRAYPKHMIDLVEVSIPEKFLMHIYLMQLRKNGLNPLYPKLNTLLLKQLTEENSLFVRETNYLYRGILSHLQLMKPCLPESSRCFLKQDALHHFMLSLMDRGEECSKRFLSVGDSMYESLERICSTTDCQFKSSGTQKELLSDSSKLYRSITGICGRSSLKTSVKCDFTKYRQRCYFRQEDCEENYIKYKIALNATNDDLKTVIKRILQNLFAFGSYYVTITTHVISSAYLANFYYTALQDYKKTSAVCDTILDFPAGSPKAGHGSSEPAFPLYLTNELCPIFDEHFRTVLGLVILCRRVVTLCRRVVSSLPNNSSVLVRICPAQFLKYLKIQCRRWEGVDRLDIDEDFECKHEFQEVYDTYEPLSVVFMSAVLYASRCQF